MHVYRERAIISLAKHLPLLIKRIILQNICFLILNSYIQSVNPLTNNITSIKVLSDPNALSADNLVNLAYLKPTSQSTTGWGGVSSRAVDGKESGKYNA